MDGHLVAVEVSVISRTNKWMKLDRLPVNQLWLKGLYSKAVERGCSVKKNRMFFNTLFQNVPDLGSLFLDDLFGVLDRRRESFLNKPVIDKWFKKFQCDVLRKTALVEPQLRAYNDD